MAAILQVLRRLSVKKETRILQEGPKTGVSMIDTKESWEEKKERFCRCYCMVIIFFSGRPTTEAASSFKVIIRSKAYFINNEEAYRKGSV